MARVHVADFESGAVAAQTAGTERAETSLVGQLGQGIGLVHELGKLVSCEEIADDADKRLRIDELVRRNARLVGIDQGHLLLDETLGPVKNPFRQRKIEPESFVEFVTSDRPEIISLVVEEQPFEKLLGLVDARGIAGTHSAVDFAQRVLRCFRGISGKTVQEIGIPVGYENKVDMFHLGIAEKFDEAFVKFHEFINQKRAVCGINRFDGMKRGEVFSLEELSRRHGFDFIRGGKHVTVRFITDGTEERGDQELSSSALTIKINIDKIIDIELNFHPGTAIGNDPVGVKHASA